MTARHVFTILAVLTPLALSACGEGWEMKLTNTHFPYGNQRTAGSGVMYVRAHMMPEKELKLKPVARDHAPEAIKEVKEMLDEGEFRKAQEK
jgi:hypothetical protein